MIPRIANVAEASPLYAAFLAELGAGAFSGELSSRYSDCIVLATDNSIYQVLPQAAVYPRNIGDLVQIALAAASPRFASVKFAPRGGGTGTNGQSLTGGLVVDVSRHMNRILEINIGERWARVEAGVTKDQLNTAVARHGLFFAPELSTSNRATVGGMISTDACGQGSCLYGKTRDHVLELTTVLSDGTIWCSAPMTEAQLVEVKQRPDLIGRVHRLVSDIASRHAELIDRTFPKLNRCLTGYDLAHIRGRHGSFNLNSVLCGSEGTLGFIAEAKLNLLPVPAASAIITVSYESFDAALRDAQTLMRLGPASIETIDSKIVNLARRDPIWEEVGELFPQEVGRSLAAVNFIEFVGQSEQELASSLNNAMALLSDNAATLSGYGVRLVSDRKHVDGIWEMRKRAVGLLGNMSGEKRPIAFVEDTAVPPEHLADYVAEFRKLLDNRQLDYGMFGHVDAGVLHVRPVIDLKDPEQEHLIRDVTADVVALTFKYGGLLWGEHGKGVRSEFSPKFFGPLYPVLQSIKGAFDPRNQFNPGKIASGNGDTLLTIDGVPLKGQFDRVIAGDARQRFDNAMHCNGNGVCYSWNPDDPMCPSWKGTRDRRFSPKGRAQLIREWLRQLALQKVDIVAEVEKLRHRSNWSMLPLRMFNTAAKRWGRRDFSHDVKEAFDECLACKACTGLCPVKVDIPAYRSKFFELYYGRYLRAPRDYAAAIIEYILPILGLVPRTYNIFVRSAIGRRLLQALGLVDTPTLMEMSIRGELARRGVQVADPAVLTALHAANKVRSVVIVRDGFTSYCETTLLNVVDLLQELGFLVWLAPYRASGKALQALGFLKPFEKLVRKNIGVLQALADTGAPLIGIDPAVTLVYRAEYLEAGIARPPRVHLLQEWLAERLEVLPRVGSGQSYGLLPHCTERATAPGAIRDWVSVFAAAGLRLTVLPSGCCGMAGLWGHEVEHRSTSERIFRLSWSKHLGDGADRAILADGYSCRSQVKLVDGQKLAHPAEILLSAIVSQRACVGITKRI